MNMMEAFKQAKPLKQKPKSYKPNKVKNTQELTKPEKSSNESSKQTQSQDKRHRPMKKRPRYKFVKINTADIQVGNTIFSEKSKEYDQKFSQEHGYHDVRRDIYFERRTLEGLRIAISKKESDPEAIQFNVNDGVVTLSYRHDKNSDRLAELKFDKKYAFESWAYRRLELAQELINMTLAQKGNILSYVGVLRLLQSMITDVTGEVFEKPVKHKKKRANHNKTRQSEDS